MSSRTKQGLLARVNFPLYTLQMLTSRHVIVGGGGGSSKTGVANGFVSNFTGQSNYTLAIYTFAGFHFDLNKHRGYVCY